jgi:predicted nucleic acid-binding protein
MITPVFLDTGYVIALLSPRDHFHDKAIALSYTLEQSRARLVTTPAIIFEIGAAFSRLSHRPAGKQFLDYLHSYPLVDIAPLTPPRYDRAYRLFSRRMDKEWSLADCLSFVVMEEYGLKDALAADTHFSQAGFRPLLLES